MLSPCRSLAQYSYDGKCCLFFNYFNIIIFFEVNTRHFLINLRINVFTYLLNFSYHRIVKLFISLLILPTGEIFNNFKYTLLIGVQYK